MKSGVSGRGKVVIVIAVVIAAAVALAVALSDSGSDGGSAPDGAAVGSSWANVQDFGATPDDDGDDDTAAIQAAIESKRTTDDEDFTAKGGTVYFPKGTYHVDGELELSKSVGITLLGEGTAVAGFESPPASVIEYTGAGERFMDARSSIGLTIRNMAVMYSNEQFAGDLLDFHRADPVDGVLQGDSSLAVIENSLISGVYPVRSARTLVRFQDVITSAVRRSNLAFAQRGIEGKRAPEFGFANGVAIEGNQFLMLSVGAIVNPGQGFTITNNVFEGTNLIEGGALNHALYNELPADAGAVVVGLNFTGNWLGDVNVTLPNVWIQLDGTPLWGANVAGNFFSGRAGMNLPSGSSGVQISGNYFENSDYNIDLGPATNGVTITGNMFTGGTDVIGAGGPAHQNLHVAGNSTGDSATAPSPGQ